MKLQVNPTIDGRLQDQLTTMINHKTGKPFDVTFEEGMYWSHRAIEINAQSGGDEDFVAKISRNEPSSGGK